MTRLTSVFSAVACAAAVGLLSGVAPTASAPVHRSQQTAMTATRASLTTGQQLAPSDRLVAPDGLHTLVMQPDGNLVLRAGGLAVWATHTEGRRGAYLVLQPDGNLVLRQGHRAVWASGTASTRMSSGVGLSIQDDGNLVLYRSSGAHTPRALWESNTPDSALKQVRVRTGCPATLTQSKQVANAPEGLVTSLVPAGVAPESALVCRYSGDLPDGSSARTLLRATSLGRTAAARLATALARVTLGFPSVGLPPCPSGEGNSTIIALQYPHRSTDVDIMYSANGCRSLNNGYVTAYQPANPSFGVFQSVLAGLVPGSN